MSANEAIEDAAIGALIAALREEGREAALLAHPDRDPEHEHELTVDAVVGIDGVEWAVEHTRPMPPPSRTPRNDHAQRMLRPGCKPLRALPGSPWPSVLIRPREQTTPMRTTSRSSTWRTKQLLQART